MYLIAEVGINANGNTALVEKMIKEAARCGANAVKFQKRNINIVYSQKFLDSPRSSPWGDTQRAQKEGLEFSVADYHEIAAICKKVGIEWFASAWDIDSLDFIDLFDPPYHKVASAMITNKPFLEAVAAKNRRVILSTGMATMGQIFAAVDILEDCNPIIMHCVSIYPCPDELCNIKVIETFKEKFYGYTIGYSGHERGIMPSLAAVALGAEVVERHFTLDRTMYGSDQAASLEPRGLARLAEYAAQIKKCMRAGEKVINPQELECAKKLRYWEV